MEARALITLDGKEAVSGVAAPVPWWSFTKTVLAVCALSLVEEGLLSLDERPWDAPYTFAHLLRHEAGLPDYGGLKRYHEDVASGRAPWPVDRLLAAVKTPGAVVAVGDFNSAADGSNTATYSQITADYFRDAWSGGAGLSCCQAPLLDNATSVLHERIDLVLTHAVHPKSTTLVGATPFQGHAPYWAADHAGVVASLRLH